ncbi:phosphoribosylglycinamide formyltransferase [Agrococcus versicolor]|uniref:Phosphoribosylglycinamide formyltransferase n=1 Tax=Agrococcus versicolor TaxID=501482 RepID=A0ABP5MJV9_9MICO
MLRLVVLVSGGGSNLADLLERTRDGRVPATIVAVGADQECGGIELAKAAGIATFVEPFAHPRADWSDRLVARVLEHEPQLTVLSGFMRLLSAEAVDRLSPNLVNTHPAYLPEFPGAHAVRDAIAAGATQSGASVIVVDAGVDTGPVLAQVRVPIHPDDDEASLHDRIKVVERDLLADVVTNWNEETE